MEAYRIQPVTIGEVDIDGEKYQNAFAGRFTANDWSMSGAPHVIMPEEQFHKIIKALPDGMAAKLGLPLWAALVLHQ